MLIYSFATIFMRLSHLNMESICDNLNKGLFQYGKIVQYKQINVINFFPWRFSIQYKTVEPFDKKKEPTIKVILMNSCTLYIAHQSLLCLLSKDGISFKITFAYLFIFVEWKSTLTNMEAIIECWIQSDGVIQFYL